MSIYSVILAGGNGERFKPVSNGIPKQFFKLENNSTMLQHTIDRCLNISELDKIFVVAPQDFKEDVLSNIHTKGMSEKNIILEPFKNNTLAAVILACSYIYSLDKNANVFITSVDLYTEGLTDFIPKINLVDNILAELRLKMFVLINIHNEYNSNYTYFIPKKALNNSSDIYTVKGSINKPSDKEIDMLQVSYDYLLADLGMFVFNAYGFLKLINNQFIFNFDYKKVIENYKLITNTTIDLYLANNKDKIYCVDIKDRFYDIGIPYTYLLLKDKIK